MVVEEVITKVKDIGTLRIAVLIIAVGLQLYFVHSTTPVPNYDSTTKTVMYSSKDIVPPRPITSDLALISSTAIVALFYLGLQKSNAPGIIDHETALNIVKADLKKMQESDKQKDPRFINATISTTDFTLKRTQVDKENTTEMIPVRYIIISTIHPQTETRVPTFYYRHEINPYTGRIERRFESSTELKSRMMCSICGQGNTADVKFIMGQNLKDMDWFVRAVMRRGDIK